jgi:N-acyl-D-amino-acid deacylase
MLLVAVEARATATGCALPGLEPFDEAMAELLEKNAVPGGGLAVARGARLVLARGYGLADKESGTRVTPSTRFRLASLSKPVAAVAALVLVDEGRLSLDDRILPLLGKRGPRPEKITDRRVDRITVRDLLQHSAGFDRAVSGDVVFLPQAAEAMTRQGAKAPPDCPTVLRDALERKLDFDPGSRVAYSNLGYCILGRVIEAASGKSFPDFIRERVLEPAGATTIAPGRTIAKLPDEASYYDYPGAPLLTAMPGIGKGGVRAPYGRFAIETMDSYGGLVGTPTAYLRFLLAVAGENGRPLLSPPMREAMLIRPALAEIDEVPPTWRGLGFQVRVLADGQTNWWHTGSLHGTAAFAARYAAGYTVVALFNSRPKDRYQFRREVDATLSAAIRSVTAWPEGDLFESCAEVAAP